MPEKEPPTLLAAWLEITRPWRTVFAQERTFVRAARHALGSLLVLGRATVARILWISGREQKSWSGEYFLFARAGWDPQALFAPLLEQALAFCPGKLVGVAVDDTRLRKTGRSIQQAAWHRDPMSPPFHTNLMLGLRFLQASFVSAIAPYRRVLSPRSSHSIRRSLGRQEARQARGGGKLGPVQGRQKAS